MAGFVSATVGFAAPIALAAMAFGKYFVGVFGVGSPVVLSFVIVWVVAAFHFGNLRVGSAFQNLFTLVKLLLIGALITAGFFVPAKQPISFLPGPGDTMSIFSGSFAIALVMPGIVYSDVQRSRSMRSSASPASKRPCRTMGKRKGDRASASLFAYLSSLYHG